MPETKEKSPIVKQSIQELIEEHKKTLAVGLGLLVLLFVLGVVFSRKKPLPTSGTPGEQWIDYKSQVLGFFVSYPSSWSVKETNAESGPDILVMDGSGSAFVRVRGFLDVELNSEQAVQTSISDYQKTLGLQEGAIVSDFKTEEIKDNIGGFSASGEFSAGGKAYRFFERGWLSMAGQVLILRAADAPAKFDESLPAMKKIMDSFKIQ